MALSLFGYTDPFTEMDRFFDSFWRTSPGRSSFPTHSTALSTKEWNWRPAFDVKETEKEIILQGDLPGINKEDLKIELHDGRLTISGERKYEKKEESEKEHRMERVHGSFVRSFAVPQELKEDQVKATFDKGVLEITFPKPQLEEPTKPRTITIQ